MVIMLKHVHTQLLSKIRVYKILIQQQERITWKVQVLNGLKHSDTEIRKWQFLELVFVYRLLLSKW